MNARKFFNVRVSLTVTALALSGAMVFSAMTTSCAGGGGGGSAGSGSGGSGNGGTSGGGTSGGGSTGATTCSDPSADAVNFCNGKAQGLMTGYAYIALGKADTASDPKCAPDSAKPETTRAISAEGSDPGPCPTTGTTVWKKADSLCISGSIPAVVGGDYTGNWGLQIGVNTIDPPATAAGAGTLGKTFSTITATTEGTVSPTNTAIRLVIHLVGTPATDNPYCATMKESGKAMNLTSFNTECWSGSTCTTTTCKQLGASDIPNIDKIGIQISSDTSNLYTVTDYCLKGFQFGN